VQCNSPRRKELSIAQNQRSRSQLEEWNYVIHSPGRPGEVMLLGCQASSEMVNY